MKEKRKIMLERFVKQTTFESQEDFIKNFKVIVPENFNFGYDVVDVWADEEPNRKFPLRSFRPLLIFQT